MTRRVICIDGITGVGKSTAAKIIAGEIGGRVISGEDMWVEIFDKNDIVKSMDDLYKLLTSPAQKIAGIMKKLTPIFNKEIENIADGEADTVIIDWTGISKSKLWTGADLRIVIESDEEKRIDHYTREGLKPCVVSREMAVNLGMAWIKTANDAKRTADIILRNEYDTELNETLRAVCDVIKQDLICIAAPCGSGKTTAAKILRDYIGAQIYDNKKMRTALHECGINAFVKPIDNKFTKNAFESIKHNPFFIRKFAEILRDANADIVIADDFMINEFFQWRTAIARIYIASDPTIRIDKFIDRQLKRGIVLDKHAETVAQRSLDTIYKKAQETADYVVFNNYDKAFAGDIEAIGAEIKSLGFKQTQPLRE